MCLPKNQGGLGFRDIKQFNIAMLGKQGWRLMVTPESLCARVLKGKYYHNSDYVGHQKEERLPHLECDFGRKESTPIGCNQAHW